MMITLTISSSTSTQSICINLIRLEESGSVFLPSYMNAYGVLWNTTQTHQNAHFNMVDRALKGPERYSRNETVAERLAATFAPRLLG